VQFVGSLQPPAGVVGLCGWVATVCHLDVKSASSSRPDSKPQELTAQLHAEVADKMALLDEFEQKFARQYRAWEEERAALQAEIEALRKDARLRAAGTRTSTAAAALRQSADGELSEHQSALRCENTALTGAPQPTPSSPSQSNPPPNESQPKTHTGASNADSDLSSDDAHRPEHRLSEARAALSEAREREVLLLEAYEQLERDVGGEIDRALAKQVRWGFACVLRLEGWLEGGRGGKTGWRFTMWGQRTQSTTQTHSPTQTN